MSAFSLFFGPCTELETQCVTKKYSLKPSCISKHTTRRLSACDRSTLIEINGRNTARSRSSTRGAQRPWESRAGMPNQNSKVVFLPSINLWRQSWVFRGTRNLGMRWCAVGDSFPSPHSLLHSTCLRNSLQLYPKTYAFSVERHFSPQGLLHWLCFNLAQALEQAGLSQHYHIRLIRKVEAALSVDEASALHLQFPYLDASFFQNLHVVSQTSPVYIFGVLGKTHGSGM